MSQPMTQRFRAEVVVHLSITVDADSEQDVDARARAIACTRPRIRPCEIQSITAHMVPVAEQLARDNLVHWQEVEALKRGTFSQRQRWIDGCLPEDELTMLARNELYVPLSLIPRRKRRGPSMIKHRGDMFTCMVDGQIPVEWDTIPEPNLTDDQWATFQRVMAACEEVRRHHWMQTSPPEGVRMAIREHKGRCLTCHREASEVGILVEIDWAGRLLSREYVL